MNIENAVVFIDKDTVYLVTLGVSYPEGWCEIYKAKHGEFLRIVGDQDSGTSVNTPDEVADMLWARTPHAEDCHNLALKRVQLDKIRELVHTQRQDERNRQDAEKLYANLPEEIDALKAKIKEAK